MSAPTRAYIGIGSNLEDPRAQVQRALARLAQLPDSRLVACSSLYGSAPVGLRDQPDFVNAACAIDTALAPQPLLAALLALERAHGRTRGGPRFGPRTLDLDLLLYGDLTLASPGLTLPHPRLHERAFVLYPLAEIAPGLEVPGRGPVARLLAGCRGQTVERLAPAQLQRE